MNVIQLCNRIYQQLGVAHDECVYQKALIAELWNHGATSIEGEKNVPVFYEDSKGVLHTIGSERIDILMRYTMDDKPKICLLELKATTSTIRQQVEVQQLKKYHQALKHLNVHCDEMYVINFTQNTSNTEVDFLLFDDTTIYN